MGEASAKHWVTTRLMPSILAAALLLPPASAAELDEIVVTARKREENLQTVPIAVTAITGEELSQRGQFDLTAVDSAAPNVNFSANQLTMGISGATVAARQVDVVRLLAGKRALRVRASVGAWDTARPTEGAYQAMLWFEEGAVASLVYSGYGHFDSDEWCDDISEMGSPKDPAQYGAARRRLAAAGSPDDEARLKAAGTYGGEAYRPQSSTPGGDPRRPLHQYFGPILVTCERGDLRPMPDGVWVYGDDSRERRALQHPAVGLCRATRSSTNSMRPSSKESRPFTMADGRARPSKSASRCSSRPALSAT